MTRIFIDGAHGTVGLALKEHLEDLVQAGVQLIEIDDEQRKNVTARGDAYAEADLVVLCLPDEEARLAAIRVDRANHRARILDASAAHRCDVDWVYGLPQITDKLDIQRAKYVANPGCFATACILAAVPIRNVGHNVADFYGITGYSAGGKRADTTPRLAQFGKEHRHLAEIRRYGIASPSLTTTVGSWERGMLVQATVHFPFEVALASFKHFYKDDEEVTVTHVMNDRTLPIESCNGTNKVNIYLTQLPGTDRTSIAVVLDNLGKGSAHAAAKNIRLMLGL